MVTNYNVLKEKLRDVHVPAHPSAAKLPDQLTFTKRFLYCPSPVNYSKPPTLKSFIIA
jgi:hypothetical protein